MKIYLDDNSVEGTLIAALRRSGHDVATPSDVGLSGSADPRHLEFAIIDERAVVTADREDFLDLHDLILAADGNHFGILIVRFDNNPKRDMRPNQIVAAIRKIEISGISLRSQLNILNHWR